MAANIISGNESTQDDGSGDRPDGKRGDREPVRITVSGSKRGIAVVIQRLYHLGFAQMHEWSKPQNHPQTGDRFCVLTKYVRPE